MRIRLISAAVGSAALLLGSVAAAFPAAATPAADATVRPAATVAVPYELFSDTRTAVLELEWDGLVPNVRGPSGSSSYVTLESPVPGTVVPVGSTVTLNTTAGSPP
ncbi:MAG TPA: hypothetical protein VG756_06320 [Pseudonocardiaceae bacterium]|jgi:hypothetical protein|nr:hypothetical protein [Pseudonocardiaceae bacterium]